MARSRVRWVAMCAALVGARSAPAASYVWDGGLSHGNFTVNDFWSTPNNWVAAAIPSSSADTQVTFILSGIRKTATQNLIDPLALNALTFDATSNVTAVSGSGLKFQTSTAAVAPGLTQNSSTAVTIGNNLSLDASATVGGSGDLTLSGAISGAGGLTKSGSGTLTLAGANNYTGATTISGGTVLMTASGTIASTSITVGSGTTLQFNRNDTFGNAATVLPPQSITVNGGTLASFNSFTTLGALTLNGGTLATNGGANSTYRSFQLRGGLTVAGSAASSIAGSASFSGVQLDGSTQLTTFTVANTGATGGDLVVSTDLLDGFDVDGSTISPCSLTKAGPGEMVVNGACRYTGLTTLNAGTLTIGSTGVLAPGETGVFPSTTLNVKGQVADTSQVIDYGTTHFGGGDAAGSPVRVLDTLLVGYGHATAVQQASLYPGTPAVLVANTLTFIDPTGTLDLTNNDFFTQAPVDMVYPYLANHQIFSSSAGGVLGYKDYGNGYTEVRFTLSGDTNLDGKVDVADLGSLATYYGKSSNASWVQGDTNMDGKVDVADLGNLATNYGGQLAAAPTSDAGSAIAQLAVAQVAAPTSMTASVPEPAMVGPLLVSGAVASRRRRSRRQSN